MRRIFALTAILAVLLTPIAAHAGVVFPLVPCGGGATPEAPLGTPPCTPCSLFEGLSRVINLVLFGITAPIAAFMVVLSGGMMLLGGANPSNFSTGKQWLTNTLMGVTVILLAWVATNFLVKSLGGGLGDTGAWYEFSCPAFLEQAPRPALGAPAASKGSAQQPAPELVTANAKLCTDKAALAGAYKANPAQPGVNAPSLTTLMSCIEKDPVVKALIDMSQRFTFDVNNPLCNLTHGYPVCGRCGHGRNSCHNGGRTGTQGAMGVDYNVQTRGPAVRYKKDTRVLTPAVSPTPTGEDPTQFREAARNEQSLFDEIYRAAVKGGCMGQIGLLNFEGNHTHLSTRDCDVDSHDGVQGRTPPAP